MIKIKYNPDGLRINTIGHAGYAPIGQDIICAGVSALFFAAYAELRNRGIKYFVDLDEPEGRALIEAYPKAEERHMCLVIFDTVVAGLENIAQQYPDYIQLVKEDNINGIDC